MSTLPGKHLSLRLGSAQVLAASENTVFHASWISAGLFLGDVPQIRSHGLTISLTVGTAASGRPFGWFVLLELGMYLLPDVNELEAIALAMVLEAGDLAELARTLVEGGDGAAILQLIRLLAQVLAHLKLTVVVFRSQSSYII